jgi:hypothetical protein
VNIVFSTPLVEETIFSPTNVFGAFVKNQMAVAVWGYFWTIYSIHWSMYLFLCQYHAIFVIMAL